MRLGLLIECQESLKNLEITGVTCDSRKVEKGFAFICIKGALSDGHDYAQKALEQGASVIICERDLKLDNQVLVADTHKAFATMSAKWFSNPADSLKLIGVSAPEKM